MTRMRRRKRIVMRIKPKRNLNLLDWVLTAPGEPVRKFFTQRAAIRIGAAIGRDLLHHGYLAQLVCHGKSGRILWERTYGRDPKRFKG